MFAIELGAPLLLFGPRRVRLAGAAAIALLQVLIALTGNYGFFNLLTMVLCVALLNDRDVPVRRWQTREDPQKRAVSVPVRLWPRPVVAAFAAVYAVVSVMELGAAGGRESDWPAPMVLVYQLVTPLRSVNSFSSPWS